MLSQLSSSEPVTKCRSQQSIQKVVSFAVKHFPPCGEDIWDCIVEETSRASYPLGVPVLCGVYSFLQGSINSRINVLYFLDSLCEASLLVKSHSRSEKSRAINSNGLYVQFISRDLDRIIQSIVPEGKQGLPNLVSTKQVYNTLYCAFQNFNKYVLFKILENWRSKRYVDPQKIDDILSLLDARPKTTTTSESNTAATTSPAKQSLSRNEVNKRIEQDRERHKRLRERRWVQPTLHNPVSFQPPQLACFYPQTELGEGQEELALDIEFENDWETTSDWNEDDDEAIKEEADLAFPIDDGDSKSIW